MIGTYKKKPVIIQAIQFTGSDKNLELIKRFMDEGREFEVVMWDKFGNPEQISIKTLEGNMIANIGDYIIRGIKNEYYPCKPDIFEATYDRFQE